MAKVKQQYDEDGIPFYPITIANAIGVNRNGKNEILDDVLDDIDDRLELVEAKGDNIDESVIVDFNDEVGVGYLATKRKVYVMKDGELFAIILTTQDEQSNKGCLFQVGGEWRVTTQDIDTQEYPLWCNWLQRAESDEYSSSIGTGGSEVTLEQFNEEVEERKEADEAMETTIEDNEKVMAAALNDLNDRIGSRVFCSLSQYKAWKKAGTINSNTMYYITNIDEDAEAEDV